MKAKVKELIEKKTNTLAYTGNIAGKIEKPVKVNKINDAKRLLSRLIYKLQSNEISGQDAKDLTYLLISYVTIVKDIDFERRLKTIEEKIQ